jgi:tetratricopeptide (TPR) repeat protein
MERIEQLKKFIAEDPSDYFCLYALALEYSKINNIQKAIELLKQLIQINSGYLAAYYQLGNLFLLQQNFSEAKETFEKGLEVARLQKDQKTLNELQSAIDFLED